MRDSGVEFVLNCDVGKDVSFQSLREKHSALLLATGVYKAKKLNVPGAGAVGVFPALDYLTASNKKNLGDAVEAYDNGTLNAAGKRVVVIGGGDTAMDCVRTAIRQGASSVSCVYRRNKENMPGSQREVANAEEEGVNFEWLATPKAIVDTGGKVTAVRAARMRLGLPDASGRQAPEEVPGSEFDIEADMCIQALGFDPEDLPMLFDENQLTVNRWGAVRVDYANMMTSMDGVFAVGDIVRGASLVVWAVKDGRDAAEAIHKYLKAKAATQPMAAAE